jgi:hypothetical protein
MIDAWRSPFGSALPLARAWFDRSEFELDLVSDRNTEVTDGRDLGLESLACFVDGSRTERGEAEAAALIEAKRPEIVVRRHEPDTFVVADLLAQCLEECTPDALLSFERRNERELALTVGASIGQEADRLAVALGRKSRQCKHVDQFPAPGLQRAAELVEQRLCP